jgi:hypothetical protein
MKKAGAKLTMLRAAGVASSVAMNCTMQFPRTVVVQQGGTISMASLRAATAAAAGNKLSSMLTKEEGRRQSPMSMLTRRVPTQAQAPPR